MVSGAMQSLLLCSLVLLLASCSFSTGFEYSGYCRKMCMWGRGGNLCKCSAVHFAGKRGLVEGYPRVALAGEEAREAGEELVGARGADMGAAEAAEESRGHSTMERLLDFLEKARSQGSRNSINSQLQGKDHLERLIAVLLRKAPESR